MHRHRSHQKTQKQFKKISKRKTKQKAAKVLTKRIFKGKKNVKDLKRADRENKCNQIRLGKIKSTLLDRNKRSDIPKLCVSLPLFDMKDCSLELLESQAEIRSSSFFSEKVGKIKTNFCIIEISPNARFLSIIDLAKVADVLMTKINYSELPNYLENFITPDKNDIIEALKSQGVPAFFVVVSYKEDLSLKQKSNFTKVVESFFETKLSTTVKLFFRKENEEINDSKKFYNAMTKQKPRSINWRDNRSYLLAEKVEPFISQHSNSIAITGNLRGNRQLNLNNLIHLTGIGDFQIDHIEILSPKKDQLIKTLYPEKTLQDSLNKEIQTGKTETVSENKTENSEKVTKLDLKIDPAEFKGKNFEMTRISFDFPDEYESPVNRPARQRFHKYRGLQSLKKSPWPDQTVPKYYSKLFSFENYKRETRSIEINAHRESEFLVEPWQKLRIFVSMEKEKVNEICGRWERLKFPLVLSGMFSNERKSSVVHYKLRKSKDCEVLESKTNFVFNCGFRRVQLCSLFSLDINGSNKFLFKKKIEKDNFFYATAVGPIQMTKDPVFITDQNKPTKILAQGNFESVDTNRMIIKRIILAGYPIKCKKNKAVVQHMFFSARDVKWFSSVELHTKLGLVGNIKESLGTMGNMKCIFSGFIQSNDIVCLPLYKRIFPTFENGK